MWPLFSKKPQTADTPPTQGKASPSSENEAKRRPIPFETMLAGLGDLKDLSTHDTALKFWLPEPANAALKTYAQYSSISFSAMLREFFATHCYGIYVITVLRAQEDGAFRDIPAVFRKKCEISIQLTTQTHPT